jgi:toxin ParE1/3/4
MTRLVVRPIAIDDFDTIVQHLDDTADHAIADRYRKEFQAKLRFVAEHPKAAERRPKLGKDARLTSVPPYLIIYDYDEKADVAVVLRILHSRRNITRKLVNR